MTDSKKTFWQYKLHDWFRDFTSLANPLLLLFVPFIFIGLGNVFYTLLLALLINEVIGSLIKLFFHKKRPNQQGYSNMIEKIDAGSFPSLHSSRISLVYLTLFSNTESWSLKAVFISIIIIVMFSRIQLKKHFLIDVLGGLAIGITLWAIF